MEETVWDLRGRAPAPELMRSTAELHSSDDVFDWGSLSDERGTLPRYSPSDGLRPYSPRGLRSKAGIGELVRLVLLGVGIWISYGVAISALQAAQH
jgi:hypothetical protein